MIQFFVFFVFICSTGVALANDPEFGHPLFRTFTAHDYGELGQIFAITEDPQGRMLFGAANALLAFDNSRWQKIPAPGTENDDHNPPRVQARNLFDVAIGHDNLFNGDRYKWSIRLTAINIANKDAVYNFLSTFSGTHYVTPRALTAEIGFHF